MMKQQMRFYTLAMVCSMLCNAHGTSYNPLFSNTHATNNRNTITTVTQNDTAQNTVPQDILPENTDNLFDTKRIIANANSKKEEPWLTTMEKLSALGVTATLAGAGLTNSKKIQKMIDSGSKTSGLMKKVGLAAVVGAGVAGAAITAREKRANKACAAHIIDQLRRHNFVGQLFFDKVDGEPSLHGIQCNYYKTISNDPVVEEAVFNLYKNLPNTSVQQNVSLFKKHCTESKKGQCNTNQTVCLTNPPKIC